MRGESLPLASAPTPPLVSSPTWSGIFCYSRPAGSSATLSCGLQSPARKANADATKRFFDEIEKAAFEAAHALKGVLGNLSLTSIYAPIVEITELLRNNTDMDYTSLLSNILEKKDELGRLCAD